MRRLLTLIALAVFPLASAHAQQKVDIARRTTSDVSFRLQGPFAKLRVVAWEHDSVSLTGTLPRGHRLDGGFGGDGQSPASGGKMFIQTPLDVGTGGTLEMRVPRRARVFIKGNSAEVDISGVTGDVDVSVIGGSVRVAGNPRTLVVDAMDATVTVEGNPEWMRVKTSEGDIVMRGNCTDASLNSLSGNIRVSEGAFEVARMETVTGSVTFAAELMRSASVTMTTHSGAIELLLSAKASAEIDAITQTATIENLLTGRSAIAGRDRGQEIALTVGTGDGRVVIRTFKGSVRLARRK